LQAIALEISKHKMAFLRLQNVQSSIGTHSLRSKGLDKNKLFSSFYHHFFLKKGRIL